MRKYLITGALALVVCGCMTSCTDHTEFIGNVIDAKTQAFDETFVEAYGEIQAGHDWGFGAVGQAARTRTASTESNLWYVSEDEGGYGLQKPDDLFDEEIEYVMNWFSTARQGHGETLDVKNYFVQQVAYGNKDNQGVSYTVSGQVFETIRNDEPVYRTENYTVNSKDQMDWIASNLTATVQRESNCDHVNNFNTGSGSLMYMQDSETKYGFSFKDSWGTVNNLVSTNYYMVHLVADYKGKHIDGWYVGFDYQTSKVEMGANDDPNMVKSSVQLSPDGKYNDRVVKIVPASEGGSGETPTIPQVYVVTEETTPSAYYEVWEGKKVVDIGRVMAEDLGSSDLNDMDYNDIVFEARIVKPYTEIRKKESETATDYEQVSNVTINNTNYTASEGTSYANIKLLAAGGTIPITVAGIDVHNAFGGIGKTTMINTENPNMTNGKYVTRDATDLEQDNGSKDFNYSTIDAIPVAAQYSNGVIAIQNPTGGVPHKICVPTTAPWPIERVEMNTAYNNTFGRAGGTGGYVQNSSVQFWNSAVSGKVNNLEGFGQSVGDVFDETKTAEGTVNGQTTYSATLQDAVNTTYPTVESGWTTVWTRGANDGYLYDDGTQHSVYIDRSNFSGITKGSKVRIYGVYRTGFSVYTNINDGYLTETNYNQAGYIELDVTTDNHVNTLSSWSGLSITGSKFTVTNVAIQVAAQQEYTIPERRGTVIWSGSQDLGWSTGIYLNTNLFEGAGVGTKIRVYGIGYEAGNDSWQVGLTKNIDDWPNVSGCDFQTYWTKGNVEGGVEVEWTLTANGAADVLANQTVVRGPNFTVKYVTIENPATENFALEDGQIWPTSAVSPANSVSLSGSVFNDITENDILCIYGSFTSDQLNFAFHTSAWDEFNSTSANWTFSNDKKWLYATPDAINSTKGCLELVVTADLISYLKKGIDLVSYTNNQKISKIKIE